MGTVTGRIEEIKQPRGGFISISSFDVLKMDDGVVLNDKENIKGTTVGVAVDYLTRFMMGTDVEDAFLIPMAGAVIAEEAGDYDSIVYADSLISSITGLDDVSIKNACSLVYYDNWYRNPLASMMSMGIYEDCPDQDTVENVRNFVKRCLSFFNKYGPVIKSGFAFGPAKSDQEKYKRMKESGKGVYGGYTPIVSQGDGDYLTEETMWDLKVLRSKPASKHTLQLLMYWVMGQHSGQEVYKYLKNIGIFNPRFNVAYTLEMSKVDEKIIKKIENDIICYEG